MEENLIYGVISLH